MKKQMIALCTVILIVISIVLWKNPFLVTSKYGTSIDQLDTTLQWTYVNEQLIEPQHAAEAYKKGMPVTIPDVFEDRYGTEKMYGTYISKMTIPDELIGKKIAFFIPFEYGNYRFYVNDELLLENGKVETSKEKQKPVIIPSLSSRTFHEKEIYIVMQLSNYHSKRGGFTQKIQVGPAEEMLKRHYTTVLFHFFLSGAICAVGIFSLLIGSFKRTRGTAFPFALLCFTIGIRAFFGRPFNYAETVIDVPWLVASKIESLGSVFSFFFVFMLLKMIVQPKRVKFVSGLIYVTFAIQTVIILTTDPAIYQYTFLVPISIFFLTIASFMIQGIRKRSQLRKSRFAHLIGIVLLLAAGLHDMIVVYFVLDRPMLLQIIMALYALFGVFVLSWKYRYNFEKTLQLHNELMLLNLSLDQKIQDRTDALRVANEQLERLAWRDALTGIANRHTFDIQIQSYFDEAKEKRLPLGLLMIDLDNFKKYNDYYGHVKGDQLLQRVVDEMKKNVPSDSIFARYGGEEFAIIWPKTTTNALERLGNHLVASIAEAHIEHVRNEHQIVTLSIGGYLMDDSDDFAQVQSFIHTADEALYEAKNTGKNQCVIRVS